MASGKHYVDEVLTPIIVDTFSDVSVATNMYLHVKKPSGVIVDWPTTTTDEGVTKVKYIVAAGDLNEHGTYIFQIYIEMPDWAGFGESGSFKVYKQFE